MSETNRTGTSSTPLESDDRVGTASADLEAKLRDQIRKWQGRLLDLGNRNPLINCSFNSTRGVVEILTPDAESIWRKRANEGAGGSNSQRFPWRRMLVPPPPGYGEHEERDAEDEAKPRKEWNPSLAECRSSRKLGERDFLTNLGDRALERRLRTLDGHARLSLSEQGVHCLFLAFGFLRWYESAESEVEHLSPLMLVPVSLSRASADAPWDLTEAEDDAIDNLCLRERFKQDFGMLLPPLPNIDDLEESGVRQAFLDAVRDQIATCPRWEVQDRCALGRFAFPKVAMWQDLGDHADGILANTLCRSVGGDATIPARHSFGFVEGLPDAARLDDEIPPGDIKTILDCDSSQLEAILAARRGISFVLDGPPGTGKSQTIANIIADALSEGRKVLFVSEKVSALDVVKRRLDDCGLGDFCLECHSSKANRKAVLDELKYCLDLPAEVYDDVAPKLDEAKRRRAALNNYVRSIHRRRPPLGISPYELYGHVSRLHRLGHAVRSRCDLPSIKELSRSKFEEWLELIDRAQESAAVIGEFERHPWRGCILSARTLTLSDDLSRHLDLLSRALVRVDNALRPLMAEGFVENAVDLRSVGSLAATFEAVLTAPRVPANWFAAPRDVATNVLRLHDSDRNVQLYSEELGAFVDGVEKSFPDDAISRLAVAPKDTAWFEQLRETLPTTVRRQHEFLSEPLFQLVAFIESAGAASKAMAEIVSHFPIPLRQDLAPTQLSAAVEWARLVAGVFPFHPKWLRSEFWPILRESTDAAIDRLEQTNEIAQRLVSRLPAAHFSSLCEAIDPERLRLSWETVQPFVSNGDVNSLQDLKSRLQAAREILADIQTTVQEVVRCLQIEGLAPSLKLARLSSSALPRLLEFGQIPGQWRDEPLRSKHRAIAHAAISDLREAADLRGELEERLSHRAFRATAASLAERAQSYQSLWRRWFGGFSGYRQQLAELYKGELPARAALLGELQKLHRWHRRMADVADAAESASASVPNPITADDSSSWERLCEDLTKFEEIVRQAPELMSRLPGRVVSIDKLSVEGARLRIETLIERLQALSSGTSLTALLNEEAPLSEVVRRFEDVCEAVEYSLRAQSVSGQCYASLPPATPKLVEDVVRAKRYIHLQKELQSLFQSVEEFLPANFAPLDLEAWGRVRRGVQAAQKLSKLASSLDKYREALCEPGRVDPAHLADSATELETATKRLTAALLAVTPRFSLSHKHESNEELMRRPVAELLTSAQTARPILQVRVETLATILPILKSEADVEVESLVELQSFVKGLRSASEELRRCTVALKDLDIEPSSARNADCPATAEWLLKQCDSKSITPLLQAVATSENTREELRKTAVSLRESMGAEFEASLGFLRSIFSFQNATSHGQPIEQLPLGDLGQYLAGLQGEVGSLDEWLKFSRWRRSMESEGFLGVVNELLSGAYEPNEAKSVVAARFFRLVFDQFAEEDSLLGEFDLESHEQSRERFRKLDEWEVRAASSRIRQYQLGRDDRPKSGWFSDSTSELGILQREIQKKRRQLPLRRLFAEIPDVLQRLKPCIMMSPLSVSTFLQSEQIRFDLVIFDEASQVFPWDAIGAIYRGTQLIVAGDEKQLPPTNFFNRADLEAGDEEEDDIGDYESILSLCKSIGMPGRGLRWHYRSRREPLIAFSNRHFYSGDLVTFPSIRDAASDAVRLEHVPQGRWIDRSNVPEAERVTDLVIAHLRSRPDTSLGIIAFNQSHQTTIEDAIYERRRKYPEVEALFHTNISEPLFVKNLENVQGDERDVIILSMGYGYNEHGKFLKNFGPLTRSGGERRLNVAVTRARDEVVLVASVKAADLDLTGSTSLGARLLKGYLEYAERGVDSLSREMTSILGEAESPFEQEVATALIQRGLHPTLQVGCGGFRVDLALRHPTRPGEFCLGIECDGATYHSSKTARDRDRIRQSVLENLGWRIVRIWSTDWIRNPERQLQRVLDAYERAATTGNSVDNFEVSTDEDLEDLKPRIDNQQASEAPTYKGIKDVPESVLRDAFLSGVRRGGAIDLEGLVQQTSRALGFARTGKQIRQRLESCLNDLLQVGDLRWVGERIALGISG